MYLVHLRRSFSLLGSAAATAAFAACKQACSPLPGHIVLGKTWSGRGTALLIDMWGHFYSWRRLRRRGRSSHTHQSLLCAGAGSKGCGHRFNFCCSGGHFHGSGGCPLICHGGRRAVSCDPNATVVPLAIKYFGIYYNMHTVNFHNPGLGGLTEGELRFFSSQLACRSLLSFPPSVTLPKDMAFDKINLPVDIRMFDILCFRGRWFLSRAIWWTVVNQTTNKNRHTCFYFKRTLYAT